MGKNSNVTVKNVSGGSAVIIGDGGSVTINNGGSGGDDGGQSSQSIPVYVSYAWGEGEVSGEKLVDAFYEKLPKEKFEFIQDKKVLEPGDWVSSFMKEIGKAQFVLIVISEKYLTSPYCMQELLHIKNHALGDQKAFLNKVIPIVAKDLPIYSLQDRMDQTLYWKQRIEKIHETANASGMTLMEFGVEAVAEVKTMEEFQRHVADILKWVSDVVMPQGLDGVEAAVRLLLKRASL